MKATKKKTKRSAPRALPRNSSISKSADEKYIGSEIVRWSDVTDIEAAIKQNCRYYNYFWDSKIAHSWVLKWITKFRKDKLVDYKKLKAWRSLIVLGALCKMNLDGAPLDPARIDWIDNQIDTNIEKHYQFSGFYSDEDEESETAKIIPIKKSPADVIKTKTANMIAEFDEMLDKYPDVEISAFDILKSSEAHYNTAKALVEYYKPLLAEVEELVSKKTPDLVAAYAYLSLADRKKYLALIKSIIDDCNSFMSSKKATRKPRAKKTKSSAQIASTLKYQKESNEFKVVSVSPEKIVGSSVVYLFNTKYKYLTMLVSSSKTGFSIKGTTIQGVDLDNSVRKTVRKPAEILPQIVGGTKAKNERVLREMKSKAQIVNGRVNEETLILKCF